ncbi:RloB family protein [Sulfurospirillum cavolei]|uniref:RloB family protein n=1 Tax=Sulfurospirillum cavolei TaxID=366522 RepID=UPI0006940FA3|nr:RloB family protein [Sulfurospirillum cavolei]
MGRRKDKEAEQAQKREQTKQDLKRKSATKEQIPDIIIACEDEASAPTYFKMLVKQLRDVKKITPDSFVIAEHTNTHPTGILEDLVNHKCKFSGKTYKDFRHKWIIIDRDKERVNGGGHSVEDFNNALAQAKRLKVNVAYSNDAFELWYLLHFNYLDSAIARDDLLTKVIEKLQAQNASKFARLDKDTIKQVDVTEHIFEELQALQEIAIKNAERLIGFHGEGHNPESDNPSTTVHKLVKLLNSLWSK